MRYKVVKQDKRLDWSPGKSLLDLYDEVYLIWYDLICLVSIKEQEVRRFVMNLSEEGADEKYLKGLNLYVTTYYAHLKLPPCSACDIIQALHLTGLVPVDLAILLS